MWKCACFRRNYTSYSDYTIFFWKSKVSALKSYDIIDMFLRWSFQRCNFSLFSWLQIVDKCQLFWNLLKDLDEQCWILEPEVSSFDCQYRRIALGEKIIQFLRFPSLEQSFLNVFPFWMFFSTTISCHNSFNVLLTIFTF